ncbi:MAG: hypothetical protein IPP83_10400 [Flavobacteriales bacterium]|nr:hypothetical protein [Flavobacteriales bacterium]
MNDQDLVRRLRQLRRSVVMLETELRNHHLDAELIQVIDNQMGTIALDERCAGLRDLVDALRESTLTPRSELMRDAVRACEKLKDGIEELVGRLG